jgi:BolA protein
LLGRDGAIAGVWGDAGKKQGNEILDFEFRNAKPARMRVAAIIHDKLTAAFAPALLEVSDESDHHAGHAGAAREDGSIGETHFHVRMVSEAFEGVSRVERQRLVHAALAAELAGGIHALSLKLQAPKEASLSA